MKRACCAPPLIVLALALAGCLPGAARQPSGSTGGQGAAPSEIRRIAYVTPGQPQDRSPTLDAFRDGLRALGLAEGTGIDLATHYSSDDDVNIASVARTAVDSRPDLIVAVGTPRVAAVRALTDSIPIVMLNVSDPVEAGLVASVVRPGGNVTGMSTNSGALAAKRLEVLKEALPALRHVAALATPRWKEPAASASRQLAETRTAAGPLGVEIVLAEARPGASDDESRASIAAGVAAARSEGAEAIAVIGDAFFDRYRSDVAEQANRAGLPSMHLRADFVDVGGLMAYGPDVFAQARDASRVVAKILQGASPAELPVEQPVQFEFAINLRTASQLGISLAPSVVDRATKLVR